MSDQDSEERTTRDRSRAIEKPSQSKKAVAPLMDAIPGQPVQGEIIEEKVEPGETTDGSSAAASNNSQILGLGSKLTMDEANNSRSLLGADGSSAAASNDSQILSSGSKLTMDEAHLGERKLAFVAPAAIQIHPVWSEKFLDTVAEIKKIVQKAEEEAVELTVFLDTEYCRRGESTRRGEPDSPDGYYTQARETVNGGDLVQVGLVIICSRTFEVQGKGCYELNLLFDASTRDNKEVSFLRSHLKMLDDHAIGGIALEKFASLLKASGLTSNEKVTWVTFQGYGDYGYMIRALEGTETLPQDREVFLRLFLKHFPSSYDLKVLHRQGICCVRAVKPKSFKGIPGSDGLKHLAAGLNVERVGEAHTAGSDALLTMSCFHAMHFREPPACQPMRRYKGILHGLMDPYACDGDSGEFRIEHVWATNFSRELKIICGLFPLLGVIAVEIRPSVWATGGAEVEMAVSDGRGWLAFDKIWTFHVHGQKEKGTSDVNGEIGAAMLAELLTQARAIMSVSLTWISSDSRTFAYLLDVLTAAPVPPEEDKMFNKLLRAFFPNNAIVRQEAKDKAAGAAVDTLRRFLGAGRAKAAGRI